MKYVIFTFSGEGLPLAYRLQQEGEDVTVAQIHDLKKICLKEELKGLEPEDPDKKKARLSMYDGMLKKHDADEVIAAMKKLKNPKDYFVFFDFNHCFQYAEQIAELGFNGNFPTEDDRRFETDRDAAKDFVKQHYTGVKIGEKHEFKTIDEGKEFLASTDDLWVLKPFDDNSEAKTKVPDSKEPEQAAQELITALDAHKEGFESQGYVMELMIPDAIEITPQRIYYQGKMIYTSCDIELKRLGSGIGPMTGCAADLTFKIDPESKLAKAAFPAIVEEMAGKHKGMFIWDISMLANPHTGKLYMGEFCPNRPGYNCFYTELAMAESVADYFEDMMAGVNPLKFSKKFGASVRMFLVKENGIKPDIGITAEEDAMPNNWFIDMKKGENGIMTAGYIWDVCIATGQGDTVDKAAAAAYEASGAVQFDNKYQRQLFDFLSEEPDSLVKRYEYGKENALY